MCGQSRNEVTRSKLTKINVVTADDQLQSFK